jgi:hypothetical protein
VGDGNLKDFSVESGGALCGGLSEDCLEREFGKVEGKDTVGDDDILDRSNSRLAFASNDTNQSVAAAENTYKTQSQAPQAYIQDCGESTVPNTYHYQTHYNGY